MQKFRPHVSSEDRAAYDEACNEYQEIARLHAMSYKMSENPPKTIEIHINAIVKFAQS